MATKQELLEFAASIAQMKLYGAELDIDQCDEFDANDALNSLIEMARKLTGNSADMGDWIEAAEQNHAEFTPPLGESNSRYWYVYDNEEETWRVDESDKCETKGQAAKAYCESYGCEP